MSRSYIDGIGEWAPVMMFGDNGGVGLLERFRKGETAALETVYRAYVDVVARAVRGALRRYGGGAGTGWKTIAAEVPDLVQEVFTRAFEPRTRERFDGVREYGPYVSQIARNVVVDHLRRKHHELSADLTPVMNGILLPPPAQQSGEDDFADFQTVAIVGRYIADLPADLRRVHEALYVQGLSQREGAQALGLGRQVIRTVEARLKEGLRNQLVPAEQENGTAPSASLGALVDVLQHTKGHAP
jgi:RNA polymerase sigma factor (sigma-70 family)